MKFKVTKPGGDTMVVEVLEDGTIKSDTDGVSLPNHENAERFLRSVQTLAGGTTTIKMKRDLRGVLIAHTHDGHTHSH